TGNPKGQNQATVLLNDPNTPIFPNVLPSAPAGIGAIQFFAKDFGNPMIHQFDLVFERELTRNLTASVAYLSSIGRGLPTFYDRNLTITNQSQSIPLVGGPLDGKSLNVQLFAPTRPLASAGFTNAITEIASKVKSEYNAFVAQISHRLAHGV